MALSPQYGWSEPDDSSLVKNGAADIRTLGNSIDTSLWNSGYGQAGKNKIISGDFSNWQRGTTFNAILSGTYSADRFITTFNGTGSTRNVSRQTFTVGTAPVAGYESQFFLRYDQTVAGTTGTFSNIGQRIEDVRTFAGQTVTVSFWAKAAATTTIGVGLLQNFGSGGSGNVTNEAATAFSVGTSWARYTYTFNVASISGKTLGAGSYLTMYALLPLNATFTFDTWGWQAEYGSKATPFQTATGSIQGELAACQRYYWRSTGGSAYSGYGTGFATLTTEAIFTIKFPTTMRIEPTSMDYANLGVDFYNVGNTAITALTLNSAISGMDWARIIATVASGLTQYRSYDIANANNANGYLGFSAEL